MSTIATTDVRTEPDPALSDAFELKLDLLADGLAIDDEFFRRAGDGYKARVEAIYGHHRGAAPVRRIPQEIVLHRPPGLAPSEVITSQVRYHEGARHVLTWRDGPVVVGERGAVPVELIEEPPFYRDDLDDGTPVRSLVQLLGTDLLGIVPSNYCALFSTKEECRFCEIIPHYASAREYARSVKPDDVQVAALNAALADRRADHLVFTTGNYDLRNERTVDHYEHVRSRLEPTDGLRRSYACLMPPDDPASLHRLRAAGFTSVLLDIEVWDPEHYAGLVPGKARWLGHDGFLRMLDAAVEVFGAGEVYSNLVYGIQSLGGVPDGRRFDGDRETELALVATSGLLERGVVPLFTVYHTTGHSTVGPLEIDPVAMRRFAHEYGVRVRGSGVVAPESNSAIFGLGSIANHFYNDSYYVAKMRGV